jgi:hypothetical protein
MSLQEFYRGNHAPKTEKEKGCRERSKIISRPTHGTPSLYISTDDRTADGFRCYKNQLL